MLPARARLTRRAEFAQTIRRGRRAGRSRLVVHLDLTRPDPAVPDSPRPHPPVPDPDGPRAGFVVSRAVGNAVVRHRVSRRLRHLVATRLDGLPPGAALVVRALPPAAGATSVDLGRDLDSALRAARDERRSRGGRQ